MTENRSFKHIQTKMNFTDSLRIAKKGEKPMKILGGNCYLITYAFLNVTTKNAHILRN